MKTLYHRRVRQQQPSNSNDSRKESSRAYSFEIVDASNKLRSSKRFFTSSSQRRSPWIALGGSPKHSFQLWAVGVDARSWRFFDQISQSGKRKTAILVEQANNIMEGCFYKGCNTKTPVIRSFFLLHDCELWDAPAAIAAHLTLSRVIRHRTVRCTIESAR